MIKSLIALSFGALIVAGCATASTSEGSALRDPCTGEVVAHRAADGSYEIAGVGRVPASQVEHVTDGSIAAPSCSAAPSSGDLEPAMWAVQVNNCLYWGDSTISDFGDEISMSGYACENADGSWHVAEGTTVKSKSGG